MLAALASLFLVATPAASPHDAKTPKKGAAECPECGADLSAQDSSKHALSHWPLIERQPERYPEEARARASVLLGRDLNAPTRRSS